MGDAQAQRRPARTPADHAAGAGGRRAPPPFRLPVAAARFSAKTYRQKIADHYAPLLTAAISDAVDTHTCASDAQAGRAIRIDLASIETVLASAIGDGYIAGRHAGALSVKAVSASAVRARATLVSEPGWSLEMDWDDWEPGDNAAAIALAADDESAGLAGLLDDAGITIKGLEDTTVELLGNSLAEGMAAGENLASLKARVAAVVGDASRGEIIARTESARASSVATMDTFAANGIGQVEWAIGDDSCDECEDNDGEVVALGDAFPSGDTEPPLHPNCRCTVLPVISAD